MIRPAAARRPTEAALRLTCSRPWAGGDNPFMSVASVLGPDGLDRPALWPEFEARREQLDMAEAVADAIAERAPPDGRGRHRRRQELRLPRARDPGRAGRTRTAGSSSPRTPSACRNNSSARTSRSSSRCMPAGVPGRCWSRAAANYLSLPPAPRRPAAAADRCSPTPGAVDQLVQIGQWSRQTPDGSKSDLPFSRTSRRLGPGPERQRQLPGPQVPRPRRLLLLQGPQGGCTGRTCSSSTTPCSSATWPCGGPAAGCCPTTRSSSSTRPTRSKTSPPTTSASRSARAASSTCSTSCSPRGTHKGLLAILGDDDAVAQLEATRQAARAFFAVGPRSGRHRAGPTGDRPRPRAGDRPERAVGRIDQARHATCTSCAERR